MSGNTRFLMFLGQNAKCSDGSGTLVLPWLTKVFVTFQAENFIDSKATSYYALVDTENPV